jgi:oligoribonuclease NrnB/cAMP/cGMP phosphodiesterase (DHH superfamily)
MKCFYHSRDLDGHCAGAIVKFFNPECELVGIDYGEQFDMDSIIPLEIVFMVDFSLSKEEMLELSGMADLVWIDHHKTALDIPELQGIPGKRDVRFSGCELAWLYFADVLTMPPAVYLLGRFDVWNHEANPNVLPFQYGMRRFKSTRPERAGWLWQMLFSATWDDAIIKEISEAGRFIVDYEKSRNAFAAEINSFETYFSGYRAIVLNAWPATSIMFDSVFDHERHEVMIAFGFTRGKWSVSLYANNDIDVSEIAKRYGGGGHKSAAGFVCDDLPFLSGVEKAA